MLRVIIFILFFSSFVLSRTEVSVFDGPAITNNNSQAAKQITQDEMSKIPPTDEPDASIHGNEIYQYVQPNELKLSMTNIPEAVYIYQIFSMDFKANAEQNLNFDLNLTIQTNNLKWINPKPNWNEERKGVYDATLWFEANSTDANISDITLVLNRNDSFFQKSSIIPTLPLIKNFKTDEYFSNIAADGLEVKKVKTSKFDDQNNITVIELETKNGNLNLFHLPQNYEKQGIESIKGDFNNQNGNYFVIANKSLKSIQFSYYNLITKKLDNFIIPIKVEEDDLSTQVNLNPKESQFEFYKDIILYALVAIFLLFFVFKRNYYYLALAILFGLYSFYVNKPFSEGIIDINAEVSILPTPNSTIFYVANHSQKVKIMTEEGNYTKILLGNKKIGWVKNENIKQN